MARSFREAEEASNAQGTVQAALNWALANAKKNPTPENIAIAKDTFAARQETLTAQAQQPAQLANQVTAAVKGLPADYAAIEKTIAEAKAAIEGVNAAGADIPGFQPISYVVTNNNKDNKDNRDAYALLEEAFKLYGLESLIPVIRGYMEDDLGPEQAKLKLKTETAYKNRFKGNELRVASGRNALSEVDYLELENDYSETLRSYGLSDYFGVVKDANSRLARQQKMAEVIGSDISAVEFKDRIKTVVTRVNMADENTKTSLRALYNITDNDLVKYFLNPAEGTDRLKEKVTAAEISAASMTQGLGMTSLGTAEELARLGIDRAQALSGYSKIAEYLPTAEKLSAIYNNENITYNKATGEEEEFKDLASAKLKRNRLASKERASFEGSAGNSLGASSLSTQYLRKSSSAGQF